MVGLRGCSCASLTNVSDGDLQGHRPPPTVSGNEWGHSRDRSEIRPSREGREGRDGGRDMEGSVVLDVSVCLSGDGFMRIYSFGPDVLLRSGHVGLGTHLSPLCGP